MNVRWQLVRRQADALVRQFRPTSGPIDVDAIAEQLELPVFECELPIGVSGMLMNDGGRYAIYVNGDDHQHRQRFTIAHEIGHFYLGHDLGGGNIHVDRGYRISALRNQRSSEGTDPREIEANEFAANLLMPAKLVDAAAKSSSSYPWLGDWDIEQLANEFHVSPAAISYRLQRLKLV